MNLFGIAKKTGCISLGTLFVLVVNLQAAIFEEPSWKNEAGATQTYYTFETDAKNPPVAIETNPYGSAMGLIEPGSSAGGWVTNTAINLDDTGAWEVGSDGFLEFTVPVSYAVIEPFTIEYMIDVIAYEGAGFWISPSVTLQGDVVSEESDFYSNLIADDSFFGGSWNHNVTTGTVVMAATATTLGFKLEASSTALSIQDVAIYTRQMVPEPAVISLVLGGSGLLLILKRRFT